MPVGTMTTKGQITIPREVRDELGLSPGSRVSFVKNAEGQYVLQKVRRPLVDLASTVPYDGPPRSLDEMAEGIAAGATADPS